MKGVRSGGRLLHVYRDGRPCIAYGVWVWAGMQYGWVHALYCEVVEVIETKPGVFALAKAEVHHG